MPLTCRAAGGNLFYFEPVDEDPPNQEAGVAWAPMKGLLQAALAGRYAVPSFCAWNAETLLVILETAERLRSPVIVMTSPFEVEVLGLAGFAEVAGRVASKFTIPAALLLDHGDSPERVGQAIDAGYTSVMLDYSAKPLRENTEALARIAALAHPRGITVEGEIGHVGKADTLTMESGGDSTLTVPDEAAAFVAATGIDALAVSIGNAHGQYTRLPKLDFERLAAIRERVGIPLVLHGGSGTPEADLRRAIGLGIAKVNVATDLARAWCAAFQGGKALWPPLAMGRACRALAPVAERWMRLTGSAGRA